MNDTGLMSINWTDGGSASGPGINLFRNSVSPANLDDIGYLTFLGLNNVAIVKTYAHIKGKIQDVTSASEAGTLGLHIIRTGVLTKVLDLTPNGAILDSASDLLTGGKIVHDIDSQGVEIRGATGQIAARSSTTLTPLFVGMGADGTLVNFRVAGASVANVTVASGVVTYGAFSGNHPSWWAAGFEPDQDPPLGSLLCACDFDYLSPQGMRETVPAVRLSDKARDKAVYGVFGGYAIEDDEVDKTALDALLARHPELVNRIVERADIPLPTPAPAMSQVRIRYVAVRPLSGVPSPTAGHGLGQWSVKLANPDGIQVGMPLRQVADPVVLDNGAVHQVTKLMPATGADGEVVVGEFAGYLEQDDEVATAKLDAMVARLPGFTRALVSRQDLPAAPAPVQRCAVRFRRVIVSALGTALPGVLVKGPCEVGDYLQSSDEPGVAEVAPDGTDLRYVIAKAWATKTRDEVALVRASIHAG
jgi:hypothetical protein